MELRFGLHKQFGFRSHSGFAAKARILFSLAVMELELDESGFGFGVWMEDSLTLLSLS